jgi:hypothetical protein
MTDSQTQVLVVELLAVAAVGIACGACWLTNRRRRR